MADDATPPSFAGPIFAEPRPGSDPGTFGTQHPSDDATYQQLGDLLKKQVVVFPKSRAPDTAFYTLNDMYGDRGASVEAAIKAAGRIVFHSVGDTGASDTRKYRDELRVADQIAADCQTVEPGNRAAFFFHLGDVVYSFGESRYYFDQFYEPYRAYPGPIFAVPGNHDSFIVPGTAPDDEPLKVFMRNFCNPDRIITQEAGSLHRTAATLPGVYFAVDVPFVRIIALFSNALEDPGVISSQRGKWDTVPDYQLDFLRTQLQQIKDQSYKGAVLIATHHPSFSYSSPSGSAAAGNHGSSTEMLKDIDTICKDVGVYPHAFLAAHAHNYQRYTRTVQWNGNEYSVPFVNCGNGGHNANPLIRATRGSLAGEPENGSDATYLDVSPTVDATKLVLEKYDDHEYGYLRITVDNNQLRVGYDQAGVRSLLQSRYDLVTVDLATHRIVAN